MRNPNVKILVAALALIVLVTVAGLLFANGGLPQNRDSADTPIAVENGVQAYLRIQVQDQVWEAIPMVDEGEYVIEQANGKTNVVHTTATGAIMHSSTCDNQSCVQQGEVTLENRDSRVLTNMIICLPNEVILEVLTPAEAGMEAK